MNDRMVAPSASVLAEFGAAFRPEPLPGGQGTVWRSGDVVLKPLDTLPEALEWQAEVLGGLSSDLVRVAPPLRSASGAFVVDGWTAWPWLAGRSLSRWDDIVAAGERFHDALRAVERPAALLEARTDRWAHADRIAWGEVGAGDLALVPEVAELLALAERSPVESAGQLVHGDLTGNVLFADGLAPAVIDFSPYWRPKALASAVVMVDAVVWFGADPDLLSTVVDPDEGPGALVRALLFRLLAEPDPATNADRFRPAIDRVRSLAT